MTKCIVLGNTQHEEVKPIEFVKNLNDKYNFIEPKSCPQDWEFIELITKNYLHEGMDLMFAHDGDRRGVLYLGHWNGGVV